MKFHSPVIITRNINELKKFYNEVLEQEIEFDFGNCISFKSGLSIWKLENDYPITKSLKYNYHPHGNKNMELCFETDEFEMRVNELKKYDLRILHDVTEENWGQLTMRLFDPDGNIVELGESMKAFVLRISDSGLSPEEVSKKTSIPIETINGYLK